MAWSLARRTTIILQFLIWISVIIVVQCTDLHGNDLHQSIDHSHGLRHTDNHDFVPSRPILQTLDDETDNDQPDERVLNRKFPDLSDTFISSLVNKGKTRAEELFGVRLVDLDDMQDDAAYAKREFAKPGSRGTQFPAVDNASSAAGLGKFGAMDPRIIPVSQQANVLLDITRGVTSNDEHIHPIDDVTGLSVPQFRALCPVPKERAAVSLTNPFDSRTLPLCARNKYRTANGVCNNIAYQDRGKESTIYRRLLESNYGDGISDVRKSITGSPLASPRLISLTVLDNSEHPGRDVSVMSVHFGQFMAHEMINSPSSKTQTGEVPQCCNTLQPTHPDCWPIEIPSMDQFSALHGRTCMEFVRTLPGIRPGCTLGPREQINQVTHFIDGSSVYGSTDDDMIALRAFDRGQLKTTRPYWQSPQYMLLPTDPVGCPSHPNGLECFKGGDKRVNVQPGLTVIHTIFMRHHNNLATMLSTVNPHWNDEKLFQETRRIVAAQLQHIIYKEYLPIILGTALLHNFDIILHNHSKSTSYDITVNPSITSEFAVAAFRLHSTIPPLLALRNADNTRAGSKRLRDSFFSPFDLYQGYYFTQCAAGMAGASWDKMDQHFTKETQNHLFQSFPSQFGLDLPAIDIQRGRDHGLQPYVKYRALCQLKVPKNWDDLRKMKIMPDDVVDRLATVYQSIEDVDLFVGGTVEKHVAGGKVGPTFACIIGEQFYRLKNGDRFWHENNVQLPSAFTQAQVDQIRKTSLARILCSNVDGMVNIQSHVFRAPNRYVSRETVCRDNNQQEACSALPELDWKVWKE